MTTRSVLCGIDFSDASVDVLRFAIDEALMRQATLDIVHAWTPPSRPLDPIGITGMEDDSAELRKALDALTLPKKIQAVRRHFVRGLPRDCVANLARQLGSELLVVGSHSQPRLARWLLGSVAESLTRVSPCPVVVVRPTLELASEKEEREQHQKSSPMTISVALSGNA
ncbi:MAG: universal stress protein [Pirellulaceae bacterium]